MGFARLSVKSNPKKTSKKISIFLLARKHASPERGEGFETSVKSPHWARQVATASDLRYARATKSGTKGS
jgi:hypothetical protein